MSPTNPRRRRRHELAPGVTGYTGPVGELEALELVLEQARAAGCTCRADVEVEGSLDEVGVVNVTVLHDPECPLVNPSPPAAA